MVVVRIWGGMGNQLSLFCVGYVVSKYLNQPLWLDISYHVDGYFRPYILDLLSLQESPKIIYSVFERGMWQVLRQNFDLEINLEYLSQREELLSLCEDHKNIYIYGDYSSKFYTTEEIANLKKWFAPRYKSPYFCNMCKLLSESECVAVHIRRTDMVDLNWVNDDAEIYYKAAIAYIRDKLIQPVFYFFSDDIQWVSKVFGTCKEFYYVKLIGGAIADVEELFLMAACKHHILTAKSTYSWWAAFLSPWVDGINISNGNVIPNKPNSNLICFDHVLINRWYHKYLDDEVQVDEEESCPFKGKEIMPGSDRLQNLENIETLIMQGKNKEAIQEIEILSVDRVSVTQNEYYKLLEFKSVALLQETCSGAENTNIGEALSIMDKLLPERKDSFEFYYNFSLALFMAGRTYESVLYAANAKRIDNGVQTFWWIDQDMQKLFCALYKKLLQEHKTHFVFLNIMSWDNMRCFYESLEIILSNLGIQVTIFECFKDDSCLTSSFEEVLKSKKILESVNNYGIEKYEMYCKKDDEYFLHAKNLIDTITEKNKEIKIITHFAEGVMAAPYPVYFIDGYSKWDRLKYITDKYDKKNMDLISSLSTKLFTERHIASAWREKVVNPSDTELVQESYNIFNKYEGPYLNFDCYVRNTDVIKEIIWIIMNI